MSAEISKCGRYRYELRRDVRDMYVMDPPHHKQILFIMLNPSTADAEQDDATIRRCKTFAVKFKCTELVVVNLFAYRATKPKDLLTAVDPVGPDNASYVTQAADEVLRSNSGFGPEGIIIAAWGAHGKLMDQDKTVFGWLERDKIPVHYLKPPEKASNWRPRRFATTGKRYTGLNQDGTPKHPLYLPSDAELTLYGGRK